jgi:hypothetical protein
VGTVSQPGAAADRAGFRPAQLRAPTASVRVFIASVMAALASLAGFTWWALESSGVAVLQTRSPDGSLRSTHVWFAEPNGELWLEAGTPENSWYRDIQQDPRVSFSATQRSGQYIARRVEAPGAHEEIRSLLREKYGVRDWWVTFLFDTSRSVAVRLAPLPDNDGWVNPPGPFAAPPPTGRGSALPPDRQYRRAQRSHQRHFAASRLSPAVRRRWLQAPPRGHR